MTSPSERLRRLAVEAAAALDTGALMSASPDELVSILGAVERLGRVVDGQRVATASAVDRRSSRWLGTDGLAQSFGFRRGAELVEQVTGVSATTARKRIRLGEAIGERDGSLGAVLPPLFPVVAHAVTAGQIGVDAAGVITTELAQTGQRSNPDALQIAERILVAQAAGRPEDVADLTAVTLTEAGLSEREAAGSDPSAGSCPGPMPADLVAVQARVWRDGLDPDGVEPRADLACARRFVRISRIPVDGLHRLRGMLTPDVAAAALSFFDSLITRPGPSFDAGESVTAETPIERRDHGQQCHDLFAVMLRAAGAATSSGTDVELPAPAPLIVSLDADRMERPGATGSISGVFGPIPLSFLSQYACDGGIQLMAGRGGKILKLGTKGRFFTAAQRRAVAVRDGTTCGVPGCDVPFVALEAHHVTPHGKGGPTHVGNCVLLCWWHHHLIDAGIWTVEMIRGRPRIRIPIRGRLALAA